MNKSFFILLTFLSFLLFNICSLPAQTAESVSTGSLPLATSPIIFEDSSISQVVPRAAALEEDYKNLPKLILDLVASGSMNKEATDGKNRLTAFRSKLTELKSTDSYSFDKISEIRIQAKESLLLCNKLQEKITLHIKSIEQLRQTWENQKASWSALKSTAPGESDALKNILREAEIKIVRAQKRLEGIEAPLVEIQKKTSETATGHQKLLTEIDLLLTNMRKDLFRRSRPAMFTPSFLRQFDRSQWTEFWAGIASLSLPEADFYSTQGWVLTLQFFAIFLFIWLLGNFDIEKAKKIKLDFLISRRFSASFFAGLAAFYPLYEDLPNIARVFLWSIMTIAGARMVAGVIETPWRRRLIYLLAGLFLATQFCYLISLPSPLFRIYVALVGFIGAAICFWRARVNRMLNASIWFILTVKTGGVTMLIVFLAQVAGFAGLSNHLLEVAIKSVFFILIVWIIDLILRGAFEAALDNAYVNQSTIIQKHSKRIIERLKLIVDVLAVFLGMSGLLSVWGIKDSIYEGANAILNLGISLQGQRISLGTVATAIVFWYVAIFSSWLIQRILDEEVYPRKKVEPGVGISINRLINYAFVIIGTVFALSTIGIGLQSLAVLMGAFGIGIGFGLQNIVNNFASGLILLFERSIKVGDVVQINGVWGQIKNLGLRATVVETYDRSELIVPNSDLVSTTVTNWTLTNRQTRVIIPVGVAYGSDVNLITSILRRIADENAYIMKFPEPSVIFMSFGNSSLDFELRVFVSDLDNMLKVRNEINREIDRLFRENNIEIPFPQSDLHIRTMDDNFKNSIQTIVSEVIQNEKIPGKK
ncbi:MAG: mechanosensitive ion channel domain-containing protein [Candidatus Riflebacteria bacterium]